MNKLKQWKDVIYDISAESGINVPELPENGWTNIYESGISASAAFAQAVKIDASRSKIPSLRNKKLKLRGGQGKPEKIYKGEKAKFAAIVPNKRRKIFPVSDTVFAKIRYGKNLTPKELTAAKRAYISFKKSRMGGTGIDKLKTNLKKHFEQVYISR